MITIYEMVTPVHDEKAIIKGYLTTKDLVFYDESDMQIPSSEDCWPQEPCMIWSEIDEKLSTKKYKIMKPIKWISCTKQQAEFLKEFLDEEQKGD